MKSMAIISGNLSAGLFIRGRSMAIEPAKGAHLSRWSSGRIGVGSIEEGSGGGRKRGCAEWKQQEYFACTDIVPSQTRNS